MSDARSDHHGFLSMLAELDAQIDRDLLGRTAVPTDNAPAVEAAPLAAEPQSEPSARSVAQPESALATPNGISTPDVAQPIVVEGLRQPKPKPKAKPKPKPKPRPQPQPQPKVELQPKPKPEPERPSSYESVLRSMRRLATPWRRSLTMLASQRRDMAVLGIVTGAATIAAALLLLVGPDAHRPRSYAGGGAPALPARRAAADVGGMASRLSGGSSSVARGSPPPQAASAVASAPMPEAGARTDSAGSAASIVTAASAAIVAARAPTASSAPSAANTPATPAPPVLPALPEVCTAAQVALGLCEAATHAAAQAS